MGSDCQALIFRSRELHPGHDLTQACVLLCASITSVDITSCVPYGPLPFVYTRTCTRTHTRKDLVGHLNRLAALAAFPFIVFCVVQGKGLFLKGVGTDAFENAFLKENGDVLF